MPELQANKILFMRIPSFIKLKRFHEYYNLLKLNVYTFKI
ncbi:hypothetical protein EFW58_02661 [Bacillus velezensis]|nr:hypothetical protein EFW58_02661 [Bacillus velezensis]